MRKIKSSLIFLLLLLCSPAYATDFKDWVNSLTAASSTSSGDAFYFLVDPSGTPLSRKLTITTLFSNIPVTIGVGSSQSVSLTAASGVLTLAGTGATNNENLKFDFETTANSVGVSSTTGVTSVNFGAIQGLMGNLTVQQTSSVPSITLKHSGEASAQSIIQFYDDATYKYSLVYDTAGDGTANFGIYDAANTAWRFTTSQTAIAFGVDDENIKFTKTGTDGITVGTDTGVTRVTTALQLVTTGYVLGPIKIVAKSSDYTIGTDDANEAYGAIFINTGASTRTFTLPSAVAGMSCCIKNAQAVAQILRLDAGADDYIVMETGARTSAAAEYYGSTADAGAMLCVVAVDATDWHVTAKVGTWAQE